MTRKENIERRANERRAKAEARRIRAELDRREAARELSEILGWCKGIIAKNERLGLSLGC